MSNQGNLFCHLHTWGWSGKSRGKIRTRISQYTFSAMAKTIVNWRVGFAAWPKKFLLCTTFRAALKPKQSHTYQVISPRSKRREHKNDHSPLSRTASKNAWRYLHLFTGLYGVLNATRIILTFALTEKKKRYDPDLLVPLKQFTAEVTADMLHKLVMFTWIQTVVWMVTVSSL